MTVTGVKESWCHKPYIANDLLKREAMTTCSNFRGLRTTRPNERILSHRHQVKAFRQLKSDSVYEEGYEVKKEKKNS